MSGNAQFLARYSLFCPSLVDLHGPESGPSCERFAMPQRSVLHTEEANEASWEAVRGGVSGALKWGAGAAVLGVIGHKMYPLYRGLTIQFKV